MPQEEAVRVDVRQGYGALHNDEFIGPARKSNRRLLMGWLIATVAAATIVIAVTWVQHQSALEAQGPTMLEADPADSESAVALGARIRDLQSQITKISIAEGLEKRLEVYAREQRAVSDRMYSEVEVKDRALQNLVEKDQLAKAILGLQKKQKKDKALAAQMAVNKKDEQELQTLLKSLQAEQLDASDLAAQSEALIHVANEGQEAMEDADRNVDAELDKLKKLSDSIDAERSSIVDIENQLGAMKLFLKDKSATLADMKKLTSEEKAQIKKDFSEWELEVKDFERELKREKKELDARIKLQDAQQKEVVKALAARQHQELENTEVVLEMQNLLEGNVPEEESSSSASGSSASGSGSASAASGASKAAGSKAAGSKASAAAGSK